MTEAATEGAPQACGRCGQDHAIIACPEVKAVDFDRDGNIMRVEFLTPVDMLRDGDLQRPADAPPTYATIKPGWRA
jgi:hypothetical protein